MCPSILSAYTRSLLTCNCSHSLLYEKDMNIDLYMRAIIVASSRRHKCSYWGHKLSPFISVDCDFLLKPTCTFASMV